MEVGWVAAFSSTSSAFIFLPAGAFAGFPSVDSSAVSFLAETAFLTADFFAVTGCLATGLAAAVFLVVPFQSPG